MRQPSYAGLKSSRSVHVEKSHTVFYEEHKIKVMDTGVQGVPSGA